MLNIIILILTFILAFSCQKTKNFEDTFLTRCSIYSFKNERMYYQGILEEGNITFYGIILLDNRDLMLRDYLLSKKVANLWEYQKDYGYTPIDIPWIIEALMDLGLEQDKAQIKASLDTLIQTYFDGKSGAFIALFNGKSKYWFGPDLDSTAHVAYLLNRYNSKKYEQIIKRSSEFIRLKQDGLGTWDSKWYGSTLLTTYLSTRLLSVFKEENAKNIKLTIDNIISNLKKNGSYADSILETSLAILILKEVNCCKKSIEMARNYLLKNTTIPMTPFLYYWFEDDQKFFDCWDKGKLTESFRNLALKRTN